MSCWRAATLQAVGVAVPVDLQSAKRCADAACERGFEVACTQRGDLLSCARGAAESCLRLADAEADRLKLHDDGQEALWALAACRHGHAASCPR